jgi:hypothetical protein
MAKETLLDSDIAAGASFIEALDKDGEAINAALWFYYPDLSQWKLLLASSKFKAGDLTGSYTKISQVLSSQDKISKNISISDIKILQNKDPLMKLLKVIVRTGKDLNQIRMTSNVLNGIYVEDALIYRNA